MNNLTVIYAIIFYLLIGGCKKEISQEVVTGQSDSVELEAGKIDTSLLILSADLHYNRDSYMEALREYDQLTKIDSMNGKFHFRKAYSLLQLDCLGQAMNSYSKAARLRYREADCHFAISTLYLPANDSLAIIHLKKALSLDPSMHKARVLLQGLKNESKI